MCVVILDSDGFIFATNYCSIYSMLTCFCFFCAFKQVMLWENHLNALHKVSVPLDCELSLSRNRFSFTWVSSTQQTQLEVNHVVLTALLPLVEGLNMAVHLSCSWVCIKEGCNTCKCYPLAIPFIWKGSWRYTAPWDSTDGTMRTHTAPKPLVLTILSWDIKYNKKEK